MDKPTQLSIPIQVNLPDNWLDLIMERIKADGDWALPVRCKDCRYYKRFMSFMLCYVHDSAAMRPDDYCSLGEKKEVE